MQCPSCNYINTKVLESRSTESGKSIRRRRECLRCAYRFTTYERIELLSITVIKKDGKKESYNSSKILKGIIRACEKTGISTQVLESIVDEIELQLQQQLRKEISSKEIGQLVLHYLRPISKIAYIRFISVFDKFTELDKFISTIEQLQQESETN